MRGGRELDCAVIDLDFEGAELFESAALEMIKSSPKERRLEKLSAASGRASQVKNPEQIGKAQERAKIKLALKEFSSEMHEGMRKDLIKTTKAELFAKLVPRGVAKAADKKAFSARRKELIYIYVMYT